MTRMDNKREVDLGMNLHMRDEEHQLCQGLPTSFNGQTMSNNSYLHAYHYGIVPSYDITPNNSFPDQFNPGHLTTSESLNFSFQTPLQIRQHYPRETQEFVFPSCLNHPSGPVSLSIESVDRTSRFNHENTSFQLPRQVNTTNLSLNIPSYSQTTAPSHLAQCFHPRMAPVPLYSSSLWTEPPTPTQTPWLEPSITSYSEDGHDEEEGEDNDENYDRPYAQLIYQCLFEADGHRMLLRDIYEWFEKYTKKPQESGSKGWQNSIRHNLSMNKAFENDKNDPAAKGGARKANSVWVLTEHAIKHGVESTTRYRKNATSRRSSNKRAPAVQRQRSGARGGRATRRAARVRSSQEHQQQITTDVSNMDGPAVTGYDWSPLSNGHDLYSPYGYSPITPNGDQMLNPGYILPYRSHYEYGQELLPKLEEEGEGHFYFNDDPEILVRQMLCQSSVDDMFQEAT